MVSAAFRPLTHAMLTLVVAAGVLAGMPPAVVAAAQPEAQQQVSVPVGEALPRQAEPSPTDGHGVTSAGSVDLPSGGSGELATTNTVSDVGGLPIAVGVPVTAGEDFLSGARRSSGVFSTLARVRVEVADRQVAAAAGVAGVLMTVSPVDTAVFERGASVVDIEVDYSSFANLNGANFGRRLRLVRLPSCALTTPELPRCQFQQPLESVNAGGTVSARVDLSTPMQVPAVPGSVFEVAPRQTGPAEVEAESAETVDSGGGPVVLAAASSPSSDGSTFTATSLSPAYSWSAGGQGGSFTWSYPLRVPDGLGGPKPDLALTYDSGRVDGKTLSQNGQASWAGEGWELQTGYVERSYRTCGSDGSTGSNVADYCWFSSYNATLVLGGRSVQLVRDNSDGAWRTDDDNGWKVEQRFGGGIGNGDNDDEHWVVTMPDGTQYWFGKHKRYTGDTQVTNSVQLIGVWGNNSGEPCALSWCMQGYRWNLDYVLDPHGNSMTLFYNKFKGRYGFNGNCCGTLEYDLSATLERIDYGTRAGSEAASPAPMQVVLRKADRCVGSCVKPQDYLDTPWDQHCTSTSSCSEVTSPVFFTPYQLAEVYTQVRKADGSGYRRVDSWTAAYTFPSTGDHITPSGDDTSPNLWLQSLTHRGYAEDGASSLTEPAITFGGTPLFNRVDWGQDIGVAPYTHYRLSSITNGVGGQTKVSYKGTDCPSRASKALPGFNPYRCFPQFFKPEVAAAGWAWFHKYVVDSVTEKDLTGAGGPDESWFYEYSLDSSTDTSLWAHDTAETVKLEDRTWSQWRGYSDVTTRHGPSGGQQTVSKTLYHRGMYGDNLYTWNKSNMVWGGRRAYLSTPIEVPGQAGAVGGRGGKCLDVQAGSTGNGTLVQLWDCTGAANQVWLYDFGGSSNATSYKNPQSGRCLDVIGGSSTNGTKIQIWDCNGGVAQKWRLHHDGSLYNMGTGKCLDIAGWGVANGSAIQLYDCAGSWNQRWQPRADGTLRSEQAQRCLDVYNGNSTDGTKIQTWTCNGHPAQTWEYKPSGSSMKNVHTGKCLDVTSSGTANGTLVRLYTCNNSVAQVWVQQANGTLKNPNSGRCLDAGNPPAHGVQMVIWDCNGGITQQWAHQIPDQTALQGKPREAYTFNGTALLNSSISSYTVTEHGRRAKPEPTGGDVVAYQARETDTKTRTWIAATGSWRWTHTNTEFDFYGLPTNIRDYGDTATAVDDRCTTIRYNQNTTKHLINTPSETITQRCDPPVHNPGYLHGTFLYYDGDTSGGAAPERGLVTRVNVLKDASGWDKYWAQQARAAYDSHGRVVEQYDALDRKTATAYTPASGAPVTSIAVIGAMGTGWTTTTVIDPGRGAPTEVTDVNAKTTIAHYDQLGRITKVWLHNRDISTTPNLEYTYTLQTSPSWVRTQTLGPNGNQITSYSIFDGRMRPRQSQTVTEDGKRMITDVRYNPRGQADAESVFYNNASGPASSLATFSDADIDRQTRYTYDNAGRKTHDKLYDNNIFLWQTETRYDGDRVGVIPPTGGTATQDLFDARGRVVEKRQFSGTPFTGAFDKTTYGYDRRDNLISVTDPAANTWTSSYDLRGRQIRKVDPDAGETTFTYDDAGQMQTSTDARGITLDYNYDTLGRRTSIYQGTTKLASWAYDTVAKGHLYVAHRWVDGLAYSNRIVTLDDAYRPTKIRTTVPATTANTGLSGDYDITMSYKVNGAAATQILPGVGGLPEETVTHTYDNNGYAQTLSGSWLGGSQTYIADTAYHYDGLIAEQLLSAPGKHVRIGNTYDSATRRLTKHQIDSENPASPGTWVDKYTHEYGYDRAGNITVIAGKTNGSRDQVECFSYDYLRRLTRAFTNSSWSCGTPTRAGADPYWREWTFDKIGNRLTQTDKDPVAGDTTWTYQVGAAGSVTPHQLKKVDATGPKTDTATRSFGYDAAGNTTAATTTSGAAQTLTWDQQGHLATITEAGKTTSYVYDADGNRLLAYTPDKTILYLPDGTELEKPTGAGDPLGTRYYAGIAVRDASGLKWTVTNHQGTSTTQFDAVTVDSTRRRVMPYGEDRTAQPADWKGSEGYVGGTRDNTGYTHLGAREYDPTLGRFISVDRIMDLADPQQWHAYSYSSSSPITFSDPTGLYETCDNDGNATCTLELPPVPDPDETYEPDDDDDSGSGGMDYCSSGRLECTNSGGGGVVIIIDGTVVVAPSTAELHAAIWSAANKHCGGDCPESGWLVEPTIREEVCKQNPMWCMGLIPAGAYLVAGVANIGYQAFGTPGLPPHTARVTILDPKGNVLYSRELSSGQMTPAQKAMGFPKGSLDSHTEVKATRLPMRPGAYMVIEGSYRPCSNCKYNMRMKAEGGKVTVVYTWQGRAWVATPAASGWQYARLLRGLK